MAKTTSEDFMKVLSQRRFFILLVLILAAIVLAPFMEDIFQLKVLMDVFLTAVFFGIIFAIRSRRAHVVIATALVLPLVVATWSKYYFMAPELSLTARIFGALFFAYAIVIILQIIARSKEVTKETIFAAIVAYLLIALMWGFIFMILEAVEPGSFFIPELGTWKGSTRFYYFSFVTITTLGYGDITPLTSRASSLAITEAVTGQMYMVVLVAWLVGMYVSRKSK